VDRRVALIKAFYLGLPTDRVKLEVSAYGFDFLALMEKRGIQLEYGELTLTKVLHKYKLSKITETQMDELLAWHVAKLCNVCLYFDRQANPLFSFNLDNNYAQDSGRLIPEVKLAVRTLVEKLNDLDCKPLVIASGRGFHVWCRLEAPVANDQLYAFMLHMAAGSLLALQEQGFDTNNMKFNLYPDVRIQDRVSLRLFGTEHAKNHVFSRILDGETLLDEEASWAYFQAHVENKIVTLDAFAKACDKVERFRP
jgi:hypothetical protein